MLPIAPLMIEHRTIERMATAMKQRSEAGLDLDPIFIPFVVDFMRTYADRTHHGKEEDILFRALKGKTMSAEHLSALNRLERDHTQAREMVSRLASLGEQHAQGHPGAAYQAFMLMSDLAEFYHDHIEREDREFFVPVMGYFSAEERELMLEEFKDFDSRMIHEHYSQIADRLGGGRMVHIAQEEGDRWRCLVCGYIYDPKEGDREAGIPPNTSFQDLPEDWVCPVCGAGKSAFEHL